MKMQNKDIQIELLKSRVANLKENGEQMNHGLIAKAKRKIRMLERQK